MLRRVVSRTLRVPSSHLLVSQAGINLKLNNLFVWLVLQAGLVIYRQLQFAKIAKRVFFKIWLTKQRVKFANQELIKIVNPVNPV